MTTPTRAQRLVDEFEEAAHFSEGYDVRAGIAAVLRHIAETEYDMESWYSVPQRKLQDLAAALTAPTLLERTMAGDAAAARAALAEPEPPADGEVEGLVAELRSTADGLESQSYSQTAAMLTRAADLLTRLAPQPVPEGPSDGPAVPEGREPASVMEEPSDEELLELMPQQFRDDLATVSRLAAHGTSPDVTPGIFRVSLNTGALEYARAVLARWGAPHV